MSIVPEEESSLQSASVSPDIKENDSKLKLQFIQQQKLSNHHHQQQQPQRQHQHQHEERGPHPSSRSRTSETSSVLQTFGPIQSSTSSSEKASTATFKSSASQTSQTGFQSSQTSFNTSQTGFKTTQTGFLTVSKSSNTLPPSYQYYGSTGEIQLKPNQSGKAIHGFTTFQQKPLPRSQSYSGNNLYLKQDFSDQKGQANNVNDFKWTIPPPPPEFQSGSFQNGSKTTQV
jgi:hypothetical protein